MKNLVATLCLTISVLLGSVGVSSAADFETGVATGFFIGLDALDRGDYATALRELTPLAELGFAPAQFYLGVMYRDGQGVAQDVVEAVRLFRLAAEQGDASAQYNLGVMYGNGEGVAQDDVEALRLFRLAAEQGLAEAQYNAAAQGDALAQNNLGVMYANGQSVIQDNVYAHMWFNIAASTGHEDAVRNRDSIASRMTPADISNAQTLARECVAKNYRGC